MVQQVRPGRHLAQAGQRSGRHRGDYPGYGHRAPAGQPAGGVELPFIYTVLLCPLVVIWYILTEVGSIIENAGALGTPIPG